MWVAKSNSRLGRYVDGIIYLSWENRKFWTNSNKNNLNKILTKFLLKQTIDSFLKPRRHKFFKMNSFEFSFRFYFLKLIFQKLIIFRVIDFRCYNLIITRDLRTAFHDDTYESVIANKLSLSILPWNLFFALNRQK